MTLIIASLLRRTKERRMYRELLRLDDHLLKDIGFNRVALGEDLAARRFPTTNVLL